MADAAPSPDPSPAPTSRRITRRHLAKLGLLLLALVALSLIGLVVWIRAFASPLEPLTQQRFDAALQRWRQQGPASYDIEVEVRGRQPATYRVEVRDNNVQLATRNGQPLKQRRTLGTWSVPGMFSTIATDLDNARRIAAGNADPQLPQLTLRAEFDSQYGYPSRYHRTENRRFGSNPEVTWEVTEFTMERPTSNVQHRTAK